MGRAVITPPVGLFQGGYGARTHHSYGTHDDLHARCVLFSDGNNYGCVIVSDIARVPKDIVKKTKEIICNEKVTPLEPHQIIIAATHTHSGPGPGRPLKNFRKAFKLYLEIMPYYLAGLVYSTYLKLEECSITFNTGESYIGHHRRTWDETTEYVDRELTVAILKAKDGDCRGILFNIGTHAVKMNPDNYYYSADFPGFAIRALQRVMGDKVEPMFLQAPCGNINPWNQPFENPKTTFDECEALGNMLAGDVLSVLGRMVDIKQDLEVRAGEKTIIIPIEEQLDDPDDPENYVKTKVYAITLGNLLSIIGVPGEMFSHFGRMMKDGTNTKYTMVQEITENDLVDEEGIFYVPTKEAFRASDEEHPTGGYEVMTAVPNPKTGYIIAEGAIDLVNGLLDT
mgnify:CR=1 FL=1